MSERKLKESSNGWCWKGHVVVTQSSPPTQAGSVAIFFPGPCPNDFLVSSGDLHAVQPLLLYHLIFCNLYGQHVPVF